MVSGWSDLNRLFVTPLRISLDIDLWVLSDWNYLGGYGWWYLLTTILGPLTLRILQLRSSSPLSFFRILLVFVFYIFKCSLSVWFVLYMDESWGSDNAGRSSWPSCTSFEESNYLRVYVGSLDARRFQGMPSCEGSSADCNARDGVTWDTRVGTRIKRWMHLGGYGAVLRKDNAPWVGMPSLRCTKRYSCIVCAVKILAWFVHIFAIDMPTASLNFVAFDKPFNQLHVCSHFGPHVETITECQLGTLWDCLFFNDFCLADVNSVPPLIRPAVFITIPDCWCTYMFSIVGRSNAYRLAVSFKFGKNPSGSLPGFS